MQTINFKTNSKTSTYLRMKITTPILFLASLFFFQACQNKETPTTETPVKRPNILIAISDDQSYPYTSIYGDKTTQTPAFDKIANEGILFHNAFVASPGCAPSRASIFTGRYPWQNRNAGTHSSEFPSDLIIFTDLLNREGYKVGYTGKGWGPGSWEKGGRDKNPAGDYYQDTTHTYDEYYPEKKYSKKISSKNYAKNFEHFLSQKKEGESFCFWFGAHEPHRRFEEGIGLKRGKKPEDVNVPPFLPDAPEIRSDILDYSVHIEWFDLHLSRIIQKLEEIGELDNTIIIVTSDNGMAFPRAKATCFEYGAHVPMAIRWGNQIKNPGRVNEDLISSTDIFPTIVEATGIQPPDTINLSGKSLLNIFESESEGIVDQERKAVYFARERHSSSRYNNAGYPQRAMRTKDFLFIRNFHPERYPAGSPQQIFDNGVTSKLHGEPDPKTGEYIGAYTDIDACPSKDFLIANRENPEVAHFFHLTVDLWPEEMLFDIRTDPGCLTNLANNPEYKGIKANLRNQLDNYLIETKDPRMVGDNPEVWEGYKRYAHIRQFVKPDWAKEAN
ncbi:sulfatase family protein [Flexithrix dorotheae]|uniref:sulfatase family protein n=1 Tax=Flexithrix dorotheae TaxID=70993 RepID=UPI000382A4B5|nr:sulfatase [Flexithrix dorotheae]